MFKRFFDKTFGRAARNVVTDGHDPNAVMWNMAFAWERKHSNTAELNEQDPCREQLRATWEWQQDDPHGAFPEWLYMADAGSIYSMLQAASCLERGSGTTCDVAEAARWYRRAMAEGSQAAITSLAHIMAKQGDFAGADAVLQAGVDQDWAPAQFWRCWYRHQADDSVQRLEADRALLERAAEQGHPAAIWWLSRLKSRGSYGLGDVMDGWRQSVNQMAPMILGEIERRRGQARPGD